MVFAGGQNQKDIIENTYVEKVIKSQIDGNICPKL
jgi:hypothetical protein